MGLIWLDKPVKSDKLVYASVEVLGSACPSDSGDPARARCRVPNAPPSGPRYRSSGQEKMVSHAPVYLCSSYCPGVT